MRRVPLARLGREPLVRKEEDPVPRRASPHERPEKTSSDASEQRRSLLIVDGDPDVSELLQDALEREGFRVFCAATAREALDLLQRVQRPSFLLLDPVTSQTDGEDLLGFLQADAAFAEIPVVVVSTAERDRVPPGVTRIIRKPFVLDDLLETVRSLMR